MNSAILIFPNQLFKDSVLLKKSVPVFLIEEFLFFKQFNFHKQKIFFHRDTMKNYQNFLEKKGFDVSYIDSKDEKSEISFFLDKLKFKEMIVKYGR